MKKHQDSRALRQFKADLQQDLWDATDEDGTAEITFDFFVEIFEYPFDADNDEYSTDID